MRAFCTVSAPLEVCASSAEQLSPGSRFLALRLLSQQQPKTLYFLVDAKSRVREVYTQTCVHFSEEGMLDTELFGLAVLIDGEYMFADPDSKLSKYGPKSWRSSHTHGLDANGRPLLELHFRVQFYIETPFMLKDETSRHYYYLQLKYNTLQRDLPRDYAEQSLILLAGLALQADLGDAPATAISATAVTATTAAAAAAAAAATQSLEACTGISNAAAADVKMENAKTTTMTLPKINKRLSGANERVLRLSTYVASTSHAAAKLANTLASKPTATAAAAVPKNVRHLSHAEKIHRENSDADYFRLEDYLPSGMHTAWSVSALRACHRENRGMSTADAQLHYIQQACILHDTINAHTFRMRMSKSENGPGNAWFVVYAKGIKIIHNSTVAESNEKQQITFLWPNITKLSFERKKFELRSDENKITLYATSDEKNKMLFTLCKETHQFTMKVAARLKEVIKREEEESNCLHACYIYSRSLHLPYKNKNDQRISVISSTSSNTTSGIVSDRVHSEDELEIMINTPPAPIAAPSTESLALAHLLDQPSVSRQTSSVGQVSLKDMEEQLAALSVRQAQKAHLNASSSRGVSPTELSNTSAGNSSTASVSMPTTASQRNTDSSTATDSPNSQHNIGSQCSSTCSTIVVAATNADVGAGGALSTLAVHAAGASQRRNSTSSSLELGFSHTAQNSTVSEAESTCAAHDYMQTSVRDETESVSGVYTLAHGAPPTETSGVYTMHSSELTGQSSEMAESEKSSHYGTFQPAQSVLSDDVDDHDDDDDDDDVNNDGGVGEHRPMDAVDGKKYKMKCIKNEEFRLRSDSNISTTSSFRGDGSDPTDKKHTLLSAVELTELIVGRGTYPNRTTVANNLHSDCDYVTLPMPLEGESYIQGHQDTAPTEDQLISDLLADTAAATPPALPQRMDSKALDAAAIATPATAAVNISNLSNIRMRSPPPYNARHEKTGLCGPPVHVAASKSQTVASQTVTVPSINVNTNATSCTVALRRRKPPAYPTPLKKRPTSLVTVNSTLAANSQQAPIARSALTSAAGGSMSSLKSEEITARFITTRPQINILKAHTSLVNDNAKPSYAAPTHCSHSLSSHSLSQQSVQNVNYVSGSQASLHLAHHHSKSSAAVHGAGAAAGAPGILPNTIGIPLVPYSLHSAHKSMSSLHSHPHSRPHPHSHAHTHHHQHQQPPPPPYPEMKPHACVLLPVIKSRQFLPPPPPSLPRQPPPPPPTQLTGVYSSQLARKQLEIYQQQLYSDVDYVIYPIQDPAVSQQEYLDAKQTSLLAAMAQTTSAPTHQYLSAYHGAHMAGTWDTACKGHAIYRSTPYLPLALSTHSRYASTQNLSDTYVQLPSAYSPLYSPSMASLCSTYEPPPPPPPLHPVTALAAASTTAQTSSLFARSRSDDNILNTLDSLPKMKRLPPPPPPPYVDRRLKKPPMPAPNEKPPPIPSKPAASVLLSAQQQQQPPPPRKPPTLNVTHRNSPLTKTSSGAQWAGERPRADLGLNRGSNSILEQLQASMANGSRQATNKSSQRNSSNTTTTTSAAAAAAAANLDIALLREQSKHLDLPLISALCNDRSLLKQTKLMVHAKHAKNSSTAITTTATTTTAAVAAAATTTTTATVAETTTATTLTANNNSNASQMMTTTMTTMATTTTATAVSATNTQVGTNQMTTPATKSVVVNSLSKPRKTSISHRHPNDKLPPLPMQLAEANNYVLDPAALKHHSKAYNMQN